MTLTTLPSSTQTGAADTAPVLPRLHLREGRYGAWWIQDTLLGQRVGEWFDTEADAIAWITRRFMDWEKLIGLVVAP